MRTCQKRVYPEHELEKMDSQQSVPWIGQPDLRNVRTIVPR